MMQHEPTVISLFAGAGGLDYGFEAAGFSTRAALEFDSDCCATLRANRSWPVIEDDIHVTPSARLLEDAGLRPGEVDVLIGGPPCQPFSKSGYWANGDSRRLADPRAGTLQAYMQCVAELQPRVFLLENVHGISYSGKEEGFRFLEAQTAKINQELGTQYRLSWEILNAADFGVPQLRQRFFLVGDRDGRDFAFPSPTHQAAKGSLPPRQPNLLDAAAHVTAWDAIGHLTPEPEEDLSVRGRWADLLPSIPEGENYLWHTNRKQGLPLFGWRTRYWSFLLKLAKSRPSWTIQAQPGPAIGPFHWSNRRLSVKEMARLQTFPENLRIAGSRSSVQRQIGNAVPSLLAEVIAREIRDKLLGRQLVTDLKLSISPKRPVPPPEPVQPAPARFHSLIGDHPEHPGTGLGRGRSGSMASPRRPETIATSAA